MSRVKKSDRLEMPRQLRTDEELGRKIRILADLDRRTIQQEILYLLDLALKSEYVKISQAESDVGPRRIASDPVKFPDLDTRRAR